MKQCVECKFQFLHRWRSNVMDKAQIEIRQEMIETMEILKKENAYVKSEIEGLSVLQM